MSKLSHHMRLMTERRLASQHRTPDPLPAMARASAPLPQLAGRTGIVRRAELRRLQEHERRTVTGDGDQR